MRLLIVAEHDNACLDPATHGVLGAARQIGGVIDILVIGSGCRGVAEACAGIEGVARVRLIDAAHYLDRLAEEVALPLAQMAGGYTHLLFAAGSWGRDVAPRVAAMLDVSMVSEVVAVVGPEIFERPVHAGRILQTVRCQDPVRILTIRPTAFAGPMAGQDPAVVESSPGGPAMGVKHLLARVRGDSGGRPVLSGASIVVAGGRGLGSREAFHKLLGALADRLGAALGATRAAVDANYLGNDCQIGQTGKIVAPELYIAVGISGAIQHLAGIRDARYIVAINKDPEAPIFQAADIGLVGDAHVVIPELLSELGVS